MTQEALVTRMADAAGISEAQASQALEALLAGITEAMAEGERVTLGDFGHFDVATREARTGRNPRTGEEISIPGKKVPKFVAGARLHDAVV